MPSIKEKVIDNIIITSAHYEYSYIINVNLNVRVFLIPKKSEILSVNQNSIQLISFPIMIKS